MAYIPLSLVLLCRALWQSSGSFVKSWIEWMIWVVNYLSFYTTYIIYFRACFMYLWYVHVWFGSGNGHELYVFLHNRQHPFQSLFHVFMVRARLVWEREWSWTIRLSPQQTASIPELVSCIYGTCTFGLGAGMVMNYTSFSTTDSIHSRACFMYLWYVHVWFGSGNGHELYVFLHNRQHPFQSLFHVFMVRARLVWEREWSWTIRLSPQQTASIPKLVSCIYVTCTFGLRAGRHIYVLRVIWPPVLCTVFWVRSDYCTALYNGSFNTFLYKFYFSESFQEPVYPEKMLFCIVLKVSCIYVTCMFGLRAGWVINYLFLYNL